MSIRPLKRFGQNFLRDPNTAAKIAAAIEPAPGQTLVEIGPGDGALTRHLLDRTDQLCVIEIDERAVELLRQRFPDLDIRHADVLKVDWNVLSSEKGGRLLVAGNLPYNITSPILFGLLAASSVLTEVVVMVQLEVAQRLIAKPRTKDYSSLSVGVQLQTNPALLFKVSRNVFHPKPNVTSAVVRLSVKDNGLSQAQLDQIRVIVRAAFNQRRKTLRNSLSAFLPRREAVSAAVSQAWSEFESRFASKRAEELLPDDFIELTRLVSSLR